MAYRGRGGVAAGRGAGTLGAGGGAVHRRDARPGHAVGGGRLLRLPGRGCSWWRPPRRPGWPRKACQTSRHCWPGVGSGRPGAAPRPPDRRGVAAPRRRPPVVLGLLGGACAPGPASAPSITRWVTRPAPSITPGWSWAACPQEPRRSRSSSISLRVLAAAAPDAAGELVRTVLGPILELPTQDRSSLLSTLQAWFDAGGSAVETGKRIYCHPNTVRYRLRRLRSTPAGPWTTRRPWPSCWPPWTRSAWCTGRAGWASPEAAPRGRCGRQQFPRVIAVVPAIARRRPRGRFRAATDTSTEAAMTNLALTLAEATAMYPERAAGSTSWC